MTSGCVVFHSAEEKRPWCKERWCLDSSALKKLAIRSKRIFCVLWLVVVGSYPSSTCTSGPFSYIQFSLTKYHSVTLPRSRNVPKAFAIRRVHWSMFKWSLIAGEVWRSSRHGWLNTTEHCSIKVSSRSNTHIQNAAKAPSHMQQWLLVSINIKRF